MNPRKRIFFLYEHKMGKAFLKLGDIEIEKQKFYSSKGAIDVGNVNIDKIVIDKFPCTKKGFEVFCRLQK